MTTSTPGTTPGTLGAAWTAAADALGGEEIPGHLATGAWTGPRR